ncbi:hypothetical protein OG216_46365 (plasmid) [Streptomycetaceae bacterium NBC_01309]
MNLLRLLHPPPVDDTERPVPRWARSTAYAIPVMLLPSSLWRLPFAFDYNMGQIDPNAPEWVWWAAPYVVMLSLITEGVALLTVGLVRGWGEVVPARVPIIGGKRVRPWAAIVPATIGGLVLTVLWATLVAEQFGLWGFTRLYYTNVWWDILVTACSVPLVLWGPMTLAVTYAYFRRRCRPKASIPNSPVAA